MIKSLYNVVGVMSGTSLDGIDLVYVKFSFNSKWNFNIISSETIPYSSHWKEKLSTLISYSREELSELDLSYCEYLALVIKEYIQRNNIEYIDFVSSHGHTALHQPNKGFTYQIGNRQSLADTLDQKVICDFRIQDIELGGQGAPLVPIGDSILFSDFDYCMNLGGFANVSFIFKKERIAFDICPVNIVLNHLISKIGLEYDEDGIIASKGNINKELLEELNGLTFYGLTHPKSLGLEWVQENIFPIIQKYRLNLEDQLSTFVEHIAIQITKVISGLGKNVLITGGGTYNKYLMSRIQFHTDLDIVIPSNEIIEFKEALIFAFLGVLRERNEINCLASVTGAKKNHSSGKIFTPQL
ncbi:anhydro-N-acetylmuramic acid kinase [Winogradskyella sp. A2]|uniref:anhydro-N-acetylmuramic acid kinase n=1 Tax=Winogradskyella sp. A2 TaxID=3366944 RepID=UPI00398C555B